MQIVMKCSRNPALYIFGIVCRQMATLKIRLVRTDQRKCVAFFLERCFLNGPDGQVVTLLIK